MFEFKIHKTSNEIEDICVVYGVCKILNDNDIEFRLKDNKSIYSIYTEEFDLENLEYYELDDKSKSWNVSSYTNNSEYINKIIKLNEYMENNLINIFNYLLNEVKLKSNKISYSNLGNGYCSKSLSTPQGTTKGESYRHYLSIIGWIHGCSYINNKKIETTLLLKPIDTDEIKKPYNITYIDKETGESKILTCINGSSEINMIARLYCETMIKYNLVNTEYSEIILINSMMTANKPLSQKTFNLNIYNNFSSDFYKEMLKQITWSKIPIDVENATSNYILNIDKYNSFSHLIRVYAKNNSFIKNKLKEEMLDMYSETVKEIYNNKSIINIGKCLNRLLRDNKGHNAQIKLHSVANEKHLQSALKMILDEYRRCYNSYGLNNEDLLDVINMISNKNKAKICADAIIAYSKVFIVNKKENEGDVK